MQRICVYCGSSSGNDVRYSEAAKALAEVLVRHELELVYGGASKGAMGTLADVAPSLLELGGIPTSDGMDGVSLFDS